MFRRGSILLFALFAAFFAEAADVAFVVGDYRSNTLRWILSRDRFPGSFCVVDQKDARKALKGCVLSARVVVVDVMMSSLADSVLPLARGKKVYAVNSSRSDSRYKRAGFIFDDALRAYYSNPLLVNYENMLLYTLHLAGRPVSYRPPVVLPESGIYHPDAPGIFVDFASYRRWYLKRRRPRYWVGLLFYQAYLDPLHQPFLDEVIRAFEGRGWGVVALYSYPAYRGVELFLREHIPVEVLVSFVFKMSASVGERTKGALERLNVPVISAINLFSETIRQWRESPMGLSSFEVAWQVNIPELSGLIEPVVLSGRLGGKSRLYGVERRQLEFLTSRVAAWIRLRHLKNSQKRVAIIYYNHSPGKHNIGASYLNVFRSLRVILERMREEGYRVLGPSFSEEEIKRLILLSGRNVGAWAPGELDELIKKGHVVMLPVAAYLEWYRELPESFRRAVEAQWGPPDACKIMCVDGRIVLPAVKLGNVVIAPQPQRGVSGDAWKMYHSHEVYPHHQYIAFYLWLKKVFKADAVVHLGTHGTLEWLPGKEVGLSADDPPFVLIQDLVDVYPYVVDDVGEGIQAKRRGCAVVIDHLTPPIERAGLYREYAELYTLIGEYKLAVDGRLREQKLRDIERKARALHLLKDLGLKALRGGDVERLEHYLLSLKEDLIPYGLHTFGVSPSGAHARRMASLVGTKDALIRIGESGPSELRYLMRALEGGYVPPAVGNDPIVSPDAIPTGKNFYGFDPTKVPSRQAWRVAGKLVSDLLKRYLRERGRYPRKVSVVLWATETIRNEGVNEAQVLWLVGMRPVWDRDGRVVGVEPIPAGELGRPRVDVVVHASGLYRDMFPDKLRFIDGAIRRAALLRDVENFISENARLIERSLEAKGLSEKEAKRLSLARVFSEKPGDYGTGVSLMTANTGFWDNATRVASVFVNRTGFAYGGNLWGRRADYAYRLNLSDVDVAVHSISSNLYRALDNDDVFQYLGGVALAVKALSGRFPVVNVVRGSGRNFWNEDISRTLAQEMRTRYFNPRWIKGMMGEGYAGAREMAKFVEYLWGWQVTTPFAVEDWQWQQAFEVYVKDRYRLGIKGFFEKNNPWAYQSMVAWMLEAIRKGYWKAPYRVKVELAREYARGVVLHGVACCEHTCNNPFLNQFVVQVISVPGVMSPRMVERFVKTVEAATRTSIASAVKRRKGEIARIATAVKRVIKGIELKQEKARQRPSSSGVPWAVLAFSLLVSVLFVAGVRRRAA